MVKRLLLRAEDGHRHPVLRTGAFKQLDADRGLYAFERTLGEQRAIVIFNTTAQPVNLDLEVEAVAEGQIFSGVWHDGRYIASGDKLHGVAVPAREGQVMIAG